eukprot:3358330-Amphidinium_carterae.1
MEPFVALHAEGCHDEALARPTCSVSSEKQQFKRETDEELYTPEQIMDELCAFIASGEGGVMPITKVAEFYRSKPTCFRCYFMQEGLRNVVKNCDRLCFASRRYVMVKTLPHNPDQSTKSVTKNAERICVHETNSQLIHHGAHCVVRKHSTMGCAVVNFGNEQLVGCILGKGPTAKIKNTTMNISPHVDHNNGTGFAACSIFVAWGPHADAVSPISPKVVAGYFDAVVLTYLSRELADRMSNPELACVRSLVHYIAVWFPAERQMPSARITDFVKINP